MNLAKLFFALIILIYINACEKSNDDDRFAYFKECTSNGSIKDCANEASGDIGTTENNTPPVILIDGDLTITQGSSLELSALRSHDTDGSITSYEWYNKDKVIISTSVSLKIDNMAVGSHYIELKITDNKGLIASKKLQIVVQAKQSQLPIITNITETSKTSTSIALQWSLVLNSSQSISSYYISYKTSSGNYGNEFTTTSPNYVANGLMPNTAYIFRIRAKDNNGFYSEYKESTSITTSKEDTTSPVFTSSNTISVNENQINVITLTATNSNSITYSISGNDSSYFNINSNTGVVQFKVAPDFETKSSYTFTAKATDSQGNQAMLYMSINILDVVEVVEDTQAPVWTSSSTVSVQENQTNAITLTATDTNNVTYSISGADSQYFNIIPSSGIVTFKVAPDFEAKTIHTFTATAKDSFGNESSQNVTVHVLDVEEPTNTLSRGLVAYYKFEDNANDSSGNGHHGTEFGGVNYADGINGRAGSFDGVDDYITIKEKNGFQSFDSPERSFTISAYIYYDENTIGMFYSNTTENGWHHLSVNSENIIRFHILDSTWAHGTTIRAINIQKDSWHLVTGVFKDNVMYIYVDGLLKSSTTFDRTVLSSGGWDAGGIRIGVYYLLDKGYFKGKVDELKIYNRALNESEVKSLYEF